MNSANSLELLLSGLFDYAGMYPPASLSFKKALSEAAGFSSSLSHPELIGSEAVLTFSKLSELNSDLLTTQGFAAGSRFRFCTLGSLLTKDFALALNEIEALSAFNKKTAQDPLSNIRQRVVSYEIKTAPELLADSSDLQEALAQISSAAADEQFRVFVELGVEQAASLDDFKLTAALLSQLDNSSHNPSVGLKVRCAGPSGLSAELLAEVLTLVAQHKLHFKTTMGLHHPIIEKERYGNSFGFLNTSAALALLKALGPELFCKDCIIDCLENDDASAFSFSKELRWRDFSISHKELEHTLSQRHFSIGSCSLAEPDEDLMRLYSKLKVN